VERYVNIGGQMLCVTITSKMSAVKQTYYYCPSYSLMCESTSGGTRFFILNLESMYCQ